MSDNEPFDVEVDSGITFAVFRPSFSQIDEPHIDLVTKKLSELTGALTKPQLVLDLSNVAFFGSSFIETMFRVWKRLQSRGDAKFALCGLSPYCREVLEVTHLDSLWTLCASHEEAVTKLTSV